jgi:hypothetical protein
MIKQLPIKDVRIDGNCQQREIDQDTLKKYVALIADGTNFPPVEVMFDGKSYWLYEGYHRYHCHLKLKKNYIKADVKEGTVRDAIFHSFGANKANGFPRQDGTCKNIILKILADDEWKMATDDDIAEWVGCTRRFVSMARKDNTGHKDTDKGSTSHTGTNVSAKDSNAKNEEKQTETIHNKETDTEKTEIKTPPVKDSVGREVPEHLREVFSRIGEFREFVKTVNAIQKTVKDGIAANDKLFAYVKIESLEADFANVKRAFRFALPYSVCCYCGGDPHNADCTACGGRGFVNEQLDISTPKELK